MPMNTATLRSSVLALALAALCAGVSTAHAADINAPAAPKRDSLGVMNDLRMKSLTQQINLTGEQQVKVLQLLNEESALTAKVREDVTLTASNRIGRIKAAQAETYARMKPLLTAEQNEKFESIRSRTAPKKKKPTAPSAPAAPAAPAK